MANRFHSATTTIWATVSRHASSCKRVSESATRPGVISRVGEAEKIYTEGVTVKFGKVSFNSPTELSLNGEIFTSRNTLIATGSRPATPKVEGLKEVGFWTNEDVFDLMNLPASLIVVGGGPVGVELGQAFARLGSKVTLVQGLDRILPKEDPEV